MAFENFSTSDWIQFWEIISSGLLSILAIIISVAALLQNSKMIQNSTRPYIVITHEIIRSPYTTGYFIVKNFGQSYAEIIDIKYSENIKNTVFDGGTNVGEQFDKLCGIILAPNQKISIVCPGKIYVGDVSEFTIKYKCCKKTYINSYSINVKNSKEILRDENCKATV